MKRRYRFIFGSLAVLAYLIFLPRDLAPALTLMPQSRFQLDNPADPQGAALIPFSNGLYAGFISEQGNPVYTEEVRYGAAVSESGLINYDSISSRLVLKDSSGGISALVDTRGYPFYSGARLFVLSTDRLRLKEISVEGDILWEHSFPSMITTCTADKKRLLVGLLSGTFVFVDSGGSVYYEYSPERGRISAAYGGALDNEGTGAMVIAGTSPQAAALLEEHAGQFQERFVLPLDSDLRRNIQLGFLLDNFYSIEQEDGFLLFDTLSLSSKKISLSGRIWQMKGLEEGRLVAVLARNEEFELSLHGAVSEYRGALKLPGSFSHADLEVRGNRLYLFLDDAVLVYTMERV